MAGNREYKSDVFSMLMQDKRRALELYNAINNTEYDNPDDVEMVTLDGGISLSVRNDASFVVGDSLSIYEHQSTVCPNMALRSLIYFVAVIKERISGRHNGSSDNDENSTVVRDGRNLYGKSLVKIPTPKFVVFYNGAQKDVLILDDSASALDFATDAALRKAIRGMNNSPTVFIVSQRAASLMYADLIIVLDDGQVAGMGTHDELLANCEVYKEIYESQFKKADSEGGVA